MRGPFGWCLLIVGLLVVFFAAKGVFADKARKSGRWGLFLALATTLAAGCADAPHGAQAGHSASSFATPHGAGRGTDDHYAETLLQT